MKLKPNIVSQFFKQKVRWALKNGVIEVEKVEEEFWKMINDIEGDVTVKYGADIQVLEKGSGFSSRFNPPK